MNLLAFQNILIHFGEHRNPASDDKPTESEKCNYFLINQTNKQTNNNKIATATNKHKTNKNSK